MLRQSAAALAVLALAGCATGPRLPPAQVVRYHLDPVARGTAALRPASGTPGIEYDIYAQAVAAELARAGYPAPPPGTQPEFLAAVTFNRTEAEGPPHPPAFSVGIGGGSFSGGRHGGVGLGGGVGFPVGSTRGRLVALTDLGVTISRRTDQTSIWEGHARGVADLRQPDAGPQGQAQRLAAALFAGFPGESGRTIEVR